MTEYLRSILANPQTHSEDPRPGRIMGREGWWE